jgi:RNA polymerase sigma factor (sigma-70 family)
VRSRFESFITALYEADCRFLTDMRDSQFEQLYEDHAAGLLGFLVYRTGDRALAEDILADAFEQVLRSRRRFDPRRGSAKTWIYSIALNKLRDAIRRSEAERRALERSVAGAATEASGLEPIDERDALMRALAQLSDEEREAVALRYGADLTVPELAKLLNESLTTAEGRVYRGLRKLREYLD